MVFVGFVYCVTAAAVVVVFFGVEATRRLSRTALKAAAGAATTAFVVSCWLHTPSWLLHDAILLAVAVFAGGFVGWLLRSEGALVSFVIAGAVADTLSVLGGATSLLVERYAAGTSLLLQYLSISVPYGGKVLPIVGLGDLFFAGVVTYALGLLGHPRAARLLVPLAGLTLALAVAFLTRFIAALPVLALATVVYVLLRRRRLANGGSGTLPPTASSH